MPSQKCHLAPHPTPPKKSDSFISKSYRVVTPRDPFLVYTTQTTCIAGKKNSQPPMPTLLSQRPRWQCVWIAARPLTAGSKAHEVGRCLKRTLLLSCQRGRLGNLQHHTHHTFALHTNSCGAALSQHGTQPAFTAWPAPSTRTTMHSHRVMPPSSPDMIMIGRYQAMGHGSSVGSSRPPFSWAQRRAYIRQISPPNPNLGPST